MFSNKVEIKTKQIDRTSQELTEDLKLKLQKLLSDQCQKFNDLDLP